MKQTLLTLVAVLISLAATANVPLKQRHTRTVKTMQTRTTRHAVGGEIEGFDGLYTIISSRPEGTLKTYSRKGWGYYTVWGYPILSSQAGITTDIVTSADGHDVYMSNPISQLDLDETVWVKGTREGNKIHMPLGQCLYFNDEEDWGMVTALLRPEMFHDYEYNEDYIDYVKVDEVTEVTFTVDDATGTITLDQTCPEVGEDDYAALIYGLAYTDDEGWAGYGDFNSVYVPLTETFTTAPADVQMEKWTFTCVDAVGPTATKVNVGLKDGHIYIAGLNTYEPTAVIVGTINGDKVEFAADQYLGVSQGYMIYGNFSRFATVVEEDPYIGEYTMTEYYYQSACTLYYDAAHKRITTPDDIALVLSSGKGADDFAPVYAGQTPSFFYTDDHIGTPVNPEFVSFRGIYDDYGFDIASANIRLLDTEGKSLDFEKVSYILYTKINGVVAPYQFRKSDYPNLGTDMLTELPYTLEVLDVDGYQDIVAGGQQLVLYQSGYDDYGIQTIYYGGGERRVSGIVWYCDGPDGVGSVLREDEQHQGAIAYDLAGRRLYTPTRGIHVQQGRKTIGRFY